MYNSINSWVDFNYIYFLAYDSAQAHLRDYYFQKLILQHSIRIQLANQI